MFIFYVIKVLILDFLCETNRVVFGAIYFIHRRVFNYDTCGGLICLEKDHY